MTTRHRGLLLDFGGVISVTLFERHRLSERLLGLPEGTLLWRGPFDPAGDDLWRDMLADRISERDYWAFRARETGRRVGEDFLIGMRMSGADRAAIIVPSRNATRPWTIDCGWTTTSMRSAAIPKR